VTTSLTLVQSILAEAGYSIGKLGAASDSVITFEKRGRARIRFELP
jgi:hypothetical protein